MILFAVRQSNRVTVKEWKLVDGALPLERPAPRLVGPRTVTVLVPYGSLFYAAAPVLEEQAA